MDGTNEKAEILIVDDQPENVLLLSKILDRPELTIIKAYSGEEALEKAAGHDLALAILDIQMPLMNGFDLATALQSLDGCKNTPTIFITALSSQDKYVFKGYELGAVDYLFKPVVPHIIRSKVDVFMRLHQQRRLIENQSKLLEEKVESLSKLNAELHEAMEQIKTLKGIIPICSHCKKVRNDKGYWEQVEKFIETNSEAGISHGICPECLRKHYPDMADEVLEKQ